MKIISHEELSSDETPVSIIRYGGAQDGQTFRMVKAHMDNGETHLMWASNVATGYFKNVFVPWDFTHPEVIEA